MSRRTVVGAVAAVALLAAIGAVVASRPDGVTVAAQGAGQQADLPTTVPDLPVDTNLQAKLRCPPVPPDMEQIPGTHFFDYPAYSGHATPEEALQAHLRENWPRTEPQGFELTGRNSVVARFENGRGVLLAHLHHGQWYVTVGNACWDVRYGPQQ